MIISQFLREPLVAMISRMIFKFNPTGHGVEQSASNMEGGLIQPANEYFSLWDTLYPNDTITQQFLDQTKGWGDFL